MPSPRKSPPVSKKTLVRILAAVLIAAGFYALDWYFARSQLSAHYHVPPAKSDCGMGALAVKPLFKFAPRLNGFDYDIETYEGKEATGTVSFIGTVHEYSLQPYLCAVD